MAHQIADLDTVMNLAEAMTNMDGDAELLQEIVELFMETGPQQLKSLANALAAGAAKDVAIKAHAMKGGASNFCARKFMASALKLEQLAKSGQLDGAEPLLAEMRTSFAELEELVVVINWQEVAQSWRR